MIGERITGIFIVSRCHVTHDRFQRLREDCSETFPVGCFNPGTNDVSLCIRLADNHSDSVYRRHQNHE